MYSTALKDEDSLKKEAVTNLLEKTRRQKALRRRLRAVLPCSVVVIRWCWVGGGGGLDVFSIGSRALQ